MLVKNRKNFLNNNITEYKKQSDIVITPEIRSSLAFSQVYKGNALLLKAQEELLANDKFKENELWIKNVEAILLLKNDLFKNEEMSHSVEEKLFSLEEYVGYYGINKMNEMIEDLNNNAKLYGKNFNFSNLISKLEEDVEMVKSNPYDYFENIDIKRLTCLENVLSLLSCRSSHDILNHYIGLEKWLNNKKDMDFNFTLEIYDNEFCYNYIPLYRIINNMEDVYIFVEDKIIHKHYEKMELNAHTTVSPGYQVLLDVYRTSQSELLAKELTPENFESLEIESNIEFKTSKSEALIKQFCRKYGNNVNHVKYLLIKYSDNLYLDENNYVKTKEELDIKINVGDMLRKQYINKQFNESKLTFNKVGFTRESVSVDTSDELIKQYRLENEDFEYLNGMDNVTPALFSLRLEGKTLEQKERELQEKVLLGHLPLEWYDLYCCLFYKEFSCVINYDNESKDKELLINRISEFKGIEKCAGEFHVNAYYDFNKDLREQLTKIKDKEEFLKNYGNKLLDKLSNSNLSRVEIKNLSSLYCYVNSSAKDKSNIKIRDIIESINKGKMSKLNIKILRNRLMDSSVLTTSLILFMNQHKFSKLTNDKLINYGFFEVRQKHWVSYWKKFSEQVKNNYCLEDNILSLYEWKELQYIEMFFGQYAGDETKLKDIIAKRNYGHIQKRIIYKEEDRNLFYYTNRMMEREMGQLLDVYWDKVFREKFKRKENKEKMQLRGYKKSIALRGQWSTSSSASGGKSSFTMENIEVEGVSDIKNLSMTKAAVFESENSKFFERTILDLPITISNMTLKPKEFAKKRYIFGVGIYHYIINSCLTYEFEKYFNHMGVEIKQDNIYGFKEMKQKTDRNIYNCIDYSEFNDQHEEWLKNEIWYSFSRTLVKYKPENYEDYVIMCNWMTVANKIIWLRMPKAVDVLYRHKGRLLSGERGTSMVNSIASMCYLYIGLKSKINITSVRNRDEQGVLSTILIRELENNRILGDDNRYKQNTFYDAIMLIRTLSLTGAILKPEKCLLGYRFSEFLRYATVHDQNRGTYEGYGNRSIISVIAGNLEGAANRDPIAVVSEIRTNLATLFIRTKESGILEELFEEIVIRTTMIKKDENNYAGPMPIEVMFLDKKQGGFGFVDFRDNKVLKSKNCKLELPKQANYIKFGKMKNVSFEAMTTKLRLGVEEFAGTLGKLNEEKFSKTMDSEKKLFIKSLFPAKSVKTNEWLENYEKYCEMANKCKFERIGMEEYFDNNFNKEVVVDIKEYIKNGLFKGIRSSSVSKLVDSAEIYYKIIDTKHALQDLIEQKFGRQASIYYKIRDELSVPNFLQNVFDTGQASNLITSAVFNLGNVKYVCDIMKVMKEYFEKPQVEF